MKVKRGHTVSKGYLKAWADERNRVDVIDVQEHHGFTTTIGRATVVKYHYDAKVLTHDLEKAYSAIETAAIPVIAKLRDGVGEMSVAERDAVISFLDMFLERGRYADKAELRVPSVLMMKDGSVVDAELALGDVITLSQWHSEVFRLTQLPLDQWEWRVLDAVGLGTGDGAVLMWRPTKDAEICTVTFPLSPTRLLVIGQHLPEGVPLNAQLVNNSRRWLVGTKGALDLALANEANAALSHGQSPRDLERE